MIFCIQYDSQNISQYELHRAREACSHQLSHQHQNIMLQECLLLYCTTMEHITDQWWVYPNHTPPVSLPFPVWCPTLFQEHYTVKNNYSIWSKKGDSSVKRVKFNSKWSENLLLRVKVYSISSKILLFLQSDPLFYSILFTVYWNLILTICLLDRVQHWAP